MEFDNGFVTATYNEQDANETTDLYNRVHRYLWESLLGKIDADKVFVFYWE